MAEVGKDLPGLGLQLSLHQLGRPPPVTWDTHLDYEAEVGKDLPGLSLQPYLHQLGRPPPVTGTLTLSTWPRLVKTCLASASSSPSTSWVGCSGWASTSHRITHLEYVAEVGKDLPGLSLQSSLHQLGGVLRLGPHQSQGHSP
jgi:hypothetical protein